MSDTTSTFNTHFVGRDGFYWWLGQIAPEEEWKENKPNKPVENNGDIKGFGERYRVRIMGYHSCVKDIPDDALPWAYVMYPVTAGGGGRNSSQSANLTQGDFVYGFFIDGEQAQTPVILGIIGNNEYNKVLQGLPQDECYIPYSGYTDDDDKKSTLGVRAEEGGGEVIEQVNSKGMGTNDQWFESATGDVSQKPIADKEEKEKGRVKEPLAKPTDCEPNPMGRMQQELQNSMKEIQRLKKSQFDSRLALVAGSAGDIASQINNICEKAAEFIAGILKTILDKILKAILNKTGEKCKDTYDLLHPNERPELRKKVEEILEAIVCLFRKLIDELLDKVKEFVCDAADKAVNAPPCLINNFVGNMLGSQSDGIQNSVNGQLGQLNSLIGGLGGNIGGGIGGIGGGLGGGGGGFLEEIMSFLKCDDDIDCSEVDEWSILDGADQSEKFDVGGLLSSIGSFAGGGGGGQGGGSSSGSGGSGGDLGQLNSLIGGLGGNIGGGIGGIGGGLGGGGGGFLEEIMSFLKCDDDIDCSEVDEWSILDGADQSEKFDVGGLLSSIGSFAGGGGGGQGGGSSSGSGGSGGDLGFGNVNIGNSFQPGCDTGPIPCGPPTPKFFGGGGSGASGNFIISSLGEIMGIDMVNGGSGYNKNTFAIVNDPCGNGGGAVIDPIIEDGEIIDIIVIDPGFGYLPEPDGSKGGDGDKFSDPDDTIIIRDDIYDPPTPPGNVVEVDEGDIVELPPGTTIIIDGADCTQTIKGGSPVVVTCPGKFTTPVLDTSRTRGDYPNTATGSYPAILYLCEIRVLESGINYASTDEIVIEPDFGAKATIQTGDEGIVIAVKVTESGEGFTEVPRVYIKTETGYNAVLVPKLCIDRVGEDVIKEPGQDGVVSVIDCVGKFNVK